MLPNSKLYLHGDGCCREKQHVTKLIKERRLENNVFIKPFEENCDKLYRNMGMLLIPSQSFESFGLTVVEAMAMSVPIVSTNVGGPAEIIIHSGGGILCSPKDSKSFAEAIIYVLQNNERAADMGKCGRCHYEKKFTAKAMCNSYYCLLKSLGKSDFGKQI